MDKCLTCSFRLAPAYMLRCTRSLTRAVQAGLMARSGAGTRLRLAAGPRQWPGLVWSVMLLKIIHD